MNSTTNADRRPTTEQPKVQSSKAAVKNKKQHIIPNCYLKSWCDPRTPAGQRPYIWKISRDGTEKKNKSPEKSFTASDRYTIKMPNGERHLLIETTLARIENDFVHILGRIRRRENLTELERARLCIFTAAMHTRTIAMGDHWKATQQRLHDVMANLEKMHDAPPTTSLETAKMVEFAPQHLIAMGIDIESPLLFEMPMTIMVTDDELGFITSDTPCVWFNPQLYKLPPFFRSPGLAQPDIEVTLPLTPRHMLLISHRKYPPYIDVKQNAVDEGNRLLRFHCHKEFVSWKGETRPHWFEIGEEPDDSWERSPEGKRALEQQEAREEQQVETSNEPEEPSPASASRSESEDDPAIR